MAKWFHADVLDKGLQEIRDKELAGVVEMHLLDAAPAIPPVYATVIADSLNDPGVNLENADSPIAASGQDRQLQIIAKVGVATRTFAASAGDLHVGILDITNSLVLAVTQETSEQAITNTNNINFPAFNLTMKQPV